MSEATIIPLDNVDLVLVERVLDQAFGSERHLRTAYRVREGMDWLPALSFAALDDSEMLVGTIQCWPVALNAPDGRAHPMIMVGPVAVLPEQQQRGFGKALVSASLNCIELGAPLPQVMIGDADYYGRFWGFTAEPTQGWQLPGEWDPARLLVRCDNPGVLPAEGTLGPWLR